MHVITLRFSITSASLTSQQHDQSHGSKSGNDAVKYSRYAQHVKINKMGWVVPPNEEL